MTGIQVGEWIRVPELWPGVWKIYRVLAGFKEDRWSLNDPLVKSERTLVFCHRLVNDEWRRSFSHQSCELSLAHVLEPHERQRIDDLLSSDSRLSAAFDKYRANTKAIDLIANLGFGNLNDQETKDFPKLCTQMLEKGIQDGLTIDEVLSLLSEAGLDRHRGKSPRQATLQLISTGFELRGDRFLYRRYRTLAF